MREQRACRGGVQPRGRIGVDLGHQFVQRRAVGRSTASTTLRFAPQPMRDDPPDLAMRRADQVAVPRRDDRDVARQQRFERGEVGAHVAVGRIDDHRRALHHVIAGEQHLRFLEQVAQVVGRVPRRVQRAQRDARDAQPLVVRGHESGAKSWSCVSPRRRRQADDLRAGRRLQRARRGRMVAVRVRAEDPANAAAAARDDRRDVRIDRRPRIDHRELVAADQIGVGSRSGHHARDWAR